MSYPILRRGSVGSDVTIAQTRLRAHGYSISVDGKFGLGTETAVKQFQKARSLAADGVVGQRTWDALTARTQREMDEDAKWTLALLGWRVDTEARFRQAVRDFQRMWNLGSALSVDGKVGPKTWAAIVVSSHRKMSGKPDISEHFSAWEFKCKCGGRYADCRRIWAHRDLVRACEAYRTKVGAFTPVSACRCKSHNAAVGGYSRSQHLYGNAMDLVPVLTTTQMKALGVASGIGIQRASGRVRHIDLRHLGPDNYPYATLSRVHTYYYG